LYGLNLNQFLKDYKMEQTPVEWLIEQMTQRDFISIPKPEWIQQAKEMEKDRESRIKELETFLQEDILDDVYYYHSPIWYRATELLNKDKVMNKEQEQIIDEVYETYNKEIIRQREIQKEEVNRLRSQWKRVRVSLIELLSKEEFINKCKTDSEFSEKWGLKIEEREFPRVKNLTGPIAHKLPSVKPK
jgi:hypothetical protein